MQPQRQTLEDQNQPRRSYASCHSPTLPPSPKFLGSGKRHALLDLCNRLPGIQPLRTRPRAIQDGMAPIQAHVVIQHRLPLALVLVAGIGEPAVRLQEDGGAEVLLAVPPVRGAGGGAAGAEDAFVQAVEFLAVGGRLADFAAVRGGCGPLQVGFDGFVLLVELGEVRDEVFDDVGVGEGVDARFVLGVCGDTTCTRLWSAFVLELRGNESTYINKPRYSPRRCSSRNSHRCPPCNFF